MSFSDAWTLDPDVVFLNHGSFGATPRAILERQTELRAELERQPLRFYMHTYRDLWERARRAAAAFVGADLRGFAFVSNATEGVNSVLRSLAPEFGPDDELLVTDHEYNASRNALNFVAERTGAKVVVVDLPLPIEDPQEVVDRVIAGVTSRTKLLLIDHITSQTGMVLPIGTIVAAMRQRGVEVLVDGAHGPGMLDLSIDDLAPTYYTGNFHKWLCAAKSSAFLWVAEERRNDIRPLSISHGANAPAEDRFLAEFEWTGTFDPTASMLVPDVIEHVGAMMEGGWPAIYARNRALALEARGMLLDVVGGRPNCPESMIATLATVALPDGDPDGPKSVFETDPLQAALGEQFNIEVPIMPWPAPPKRQLRISAHLYNDRADYERLAEALTILLEKQ